MNAQFQKVIFFQLPSLSPRVINCLQGSLSDRYLTRAVSLITSAISDRDVINQCSDEELRDCLALNSIDCFVNFLNLKGKVSARSVA